MDRNTDCKEVMHFIPSLQQPYAARRDAQEAARLPHVVPEGRVVLVVNAAVVPLEVHEAPGKYSVVNAYDSCEAALVNLHTDEPDVVLMDIELPGMDGIEGTARIKKEYANCIVLIITVIEDSEKVFQSLCAGAGGGIL